MYTDLPKLYSGTIIATSNNPFQPNFVDTRSCEFKVLIWILWNMNLQLDILTADRKK